MGIFRHMTSSPNGPDQTQRHIQLACTFDNQGNKKIPWISTGNSSKITPKLLHQLINW